MIDLDDELARVARGPLPDPPPVDAVIARAARLRRRRRARTWGGVASVTALVALVAAVAAWPRPTSRRAAEPIVRDGRTVAGRFVPGSTTVRGEVDMPITLADGATFAVRLPTGLGLEHARVRTATVLATYATGGVSRSASLAVTANDVLGPAPSWTWTQLDAPGRPTVGPYLRVRMTPDGFPVLVTRAPLQLLDSSALTTLDLSHGRSLTIGPGGTCARSVNDRGGRWCGPRHRVVVDVAGDHAFVQRVVHSISVDARPEPRLGTWSRAQVIAIARSALMLGSDNPFDASARLTTAADLTSRVPSIARPGVTGSVWVVTFRVHDASNDAWIVLVEERGDVDTPTNMQRVPAVLDALPDLADLPGTPDPADLFPPPPPPGGFTREQALARAPLEGGTPGTSRLTTWTDVEHTAPSWFSLPLHDPGGRVWIVSYVGPQDGSVDWGISLLDDETGAIDLFTGRDNPPSALLALPDLAVR